MTTLEHIFEKRADIYAKRDEFKNIMPFGTYLRLTLKKNIKVYYKGILILTLKKQKDDVVLVTDVSNEARQEIIKALHILAPPLETKNA